MDDVCTDVVAVVTSCPPKFIAGLPPGAMYRFLGNKIFFDRRPKIKGNPMGFHKPKLQVDGLHVVLCVGGNVGFLLHTVDGQNPAPPQG